MNTSVKWIFRDGAKSIECTSFPFAFRTLWNTWRKAVEAKEPAAKRTPAEMAKSFSIVSPLGKKYPYLEAKKMAEAQGLLTVDGQINSREFKR
jgi:hypothetical protein